VKPVNCKKEKSDEGEENQPEEEELDLEEKR